jgi:hypothetical protein
MNFMKGMYLYLIIQRLFLRDYMVNGKVLVAR